MTKCILVVDDDDDVRRLVELSLARVGGHDVRTAASGAECLDMLRTWRPDVVILDVMMPGQDGPATLALIRTDPQTADLPVVFLTASVIDSELSSLRALPISGVLGKPFDPMQLPTLLSAELGWAET